MDIYSFIPTTALGCYLIIVLALLHVKMTKLKKVFLGALFVYIAWTLGSVGMRLGFWPSYVVWYHVSLFGLFMIPSETLLYMEAYMYGKFRKSSIGIAVFSGIMFLINVVTGGWMLPEPTRTVSDVDIRFVYDSFGPQAVIPYLAYAVITIYFSFVLWKGVKEGVLRKREFLIVFTGKLLLLVGNILILVEPIKGFPLDMAMGIPDAFGIMLMVGISKKIRRSREARQHNMAVFGYGLAAVLSLMFAFPCENYISTHVASSTGEYGAMLLVTSVIVFFIVTHSIIDKVTESFYLKEDEIQLIRINEFRAKSV